jgi:glutamate synthase domain-containing protein 3
MCRRSELVSLRITDIQIDELENYTQMKVRLRKSKTDPYAIGKWLYLSDEAQLKQMLETHVAKTASPNGKKILAQWDTQRTKFVKIFPNEYRRALGEIAAANKQKAA